MPDSSESSARVLVLPIPAIRIRQNIATVKYCLIVSAQFLRLGDFRESPSSQGAGGDDVAI
jgi:hypothetical protein